MSFLEKAHINIGGDMTKTASGTDTESGAETGDQAAADSASVKDVSITDSAAAKKGEKTAPKRRGQVVASTAPVARPQSSVSNAGAAEVNKIG